jgi:peptide/nickel transport system permease protein
MPEHEHPTALGALGATGTVVADTEDGRGLPTAEAEGMAEKPIPLWQLSVRKYLRHRMAVIATVVLLILVIGVVFAGLIAPYGETQQNLTHILESPNGQFLFGTDTLGRDNFSRILYGGRISLLVGVSVAVISSAIGTLVGLLAGYFGGWLDSVLMRITDTVLSLPTLMVAIIAARLLSGGVIDIVMVLVLIGWMGLARIVRGQVLSLKQREFIEAARALGVPTRRIIRKHLLPNLIGLITVNTSLAVAAAILAESTLSYLGLGVSPTTTATWGNMLAGNEGFLVTAPWLVWFPGLAIVITALCVNFIGDGLRDALDPTHKRS